MLAVLSVLWFRVSWTSESEYKRAVSAHKSDRLTEAIDGYQLAIRNYTPFSHSAKDSVVRLRTLAEQARQDGNFTVALSAYRALRGSIRAIRGLARPYSDESGPVDDAIAELMAQHQLKVGGPTVRGRTRSQLIADHRALLALEPAPTRGWSFVIILSFIGWLTSTVLTIRQGLDRQARIRPGPFLRNGGLALLCFGVWIVSLMSA